jgi:HNH endonuclease
MMEFAVGDVVGHWTVVGLIPVPGRGVRRACRCKCGVERLIPYAVLRRGDSQGCVKCVRRDRAGTVADRLANNTVPDPTTGCWLWTGSVNRDGYGGLSIGGKTRRASRVSWELHYGPIPNGMLVCHRCDTPACVNPDHLFLGSARDNAHDAVAKGRNAAGERHGCARLSAADVADVRDRAARGETLRSIAASLGLHRLHVGNIVRGDSWRGSPARTAGRA